MLLHVSKNFKSIGSIWEIYYIFASGLLYNLSKAVLSCENY